MADEVAGEAAGTAPRRASRARSILAHPLTLMVLAIIVFLCGSVLATAVISALPKRAGSPLLLINAAVVIVCVLGLFWPYVRFVDRSLVALYARAGWARELLAGLASGAALFSLMVAIVAALRGYHVTGNSGIDTLWEPLTGAAIIAAFTEELFFRGILFRYIEQAAGSWIALAITSALFGGAHLFNPGATWFSSFAIAVEAGILLGAVYMLTRRLWAAMGLHAAWNFTQGWIFGLPVSGGHGGTGLMNGELTGSAWLTGGAFGLEASVPAVLVATAAGLAVLALVVRRGGVLPPSWFGRRPNAYPGERSRTSLG